MEPHVTTSTAQKKRPNQRARIRLATPYVKKWLQLRLGAWMRGKAFELVQVTPNFLERIDVDVCPITGQALTRGTGADTDASVDRVNNQAGYAAGNLAVMSVRANRAKSAYDWRDAATFVRQIEACQLGEIDGLNAREWARLAALMSYCTPLRHMEAANLPASAPRGKRCQGWPPGLPGTAAATTSPGSSSRTTRAGTEPDPAGPHAASRTSAE